MIMFDSSFSDSKHEWRETALSFRPAVYSVVLLPFLFSFFFISQVSLIYGYTEAVN